MKKRKAKSPKPEIKKMGAVLITNRLTEAETIDLALWLEETAKRVKRGDTTTNEPFRASLDFY